jgi:hypothetical protein
MVVLGIVWKKGNKIEISHYINWKFWTYFENLEIFGNIWNFGNFWIFFGNFGNFGFFFDFLKGWKILENFVKT